MRKFVAVLLTLSLLLPLPAFAADQGDLLQKIEALSKELDRLKQQMQEMQGRDEVKEQRITVVERKAEAAAEPSWLEIGGDYRFRFDSLSGKVHDYVQYTGTSGISMGGFTFFASGVNGFDVKNDTILLNRFGLNLKAKATEDIQVKARLVMYKIFGRESADPVIDSFFADKSGIFDGNIGHVPQDNTLRVDQVYATWSNVFGAPVWFSVGRRPSTDGIPANLKENRERIGSAGVPASLINYAFDGGTIGYAPDIDALPGVYAKFCYGRGYEEGYRTEGQDNIVKDVEFIGLNLVPYDTDTLHIELQYDRAFNLFSNMPDQTSGMFTNVVTNVGDVDQYGLVVTGKIEKLGPGDLNLFGSVALSKTHPNNNVLSLPFGTVGGQTFNAGFGLMYDEGNKKSRTGHAYWVGARYDYKPTGTKIGAEYNYGSKYWLAFTPASDDLWTSKVGTHGSVYEVYLIQSLNKKPIAKRGDAFIRAGFQYYKFDYTGSNNWMGEPKKISDLSTSDVNGTQLFAPLKNAKDFYMTFDVIF
ncbi:MAG: DUF3373 domain-containing protein [Alphaproteobacteria bacterium]|uniref:DUF3373 domain-containing protein n=1 Tax=Candidatus Nitrobium versatile TaxID=2884831 RepID=A0A953J589_9BACT|nr:DUF3373 domain-containing protein [Candidatus Nitrobium versatile]